ncbi:MAG: NAD(P)H-dependent glycerol-3-phosphate dehydrogenase, partial [Mangrovicoccus sp.]
MIGVMGAGAFGTALAVSLAQAGREIRLWGRDAAAMAQMQSGRENAARLPGVTLPENLHPVADADLLAEAEVILLAVPTQKLADLLRIYRGLLNGKTLVACNKGIDTKTLEGPSALIGQYCSLSHPAVLTGPSFAADIARGRPTALTLAYAWSDATRLQTQLSTPNLRLYLTDDLIGAELGGALKNVTAIACGAAMGAGLGESARAAVMTRGYAEMQRLALSQGARPETLGGLSGFGDLALTCTSDGSRN